MKIKWSMYYRKSNELCVGMSAASQPEGYSAQVIRG